ncbi:MAG: DUF3299 domain-containing protein [Rariglobus sp.]|nr:DUF3299 domain-containing protein [Rariglobus sp.]
MTELPKAKKKPVGLWLLLGFAALLGLVNLLSRLDPEYGQRVQATKAMEAEQTAEQARIAALMPAASSASKGTRSIDFGDLAFSAPAADTPDTTSTGYAAWAPPGVKALNDAQVRINGFMLPTRVENGHVRECLIMVNQLTCCYGKPPRFCDFIIAHVDAPEVAVLQDQPLVFTGRLKVGDAFEGKAWTGFYAMQVQSVGRLQ